jgi:hypothetical protein
MPNGCSGDVATTLTNVPFDRREEGGEAQAAVPPAEGLVICLVHRRGPGGGGSTLRKHTDRGATILTLANLECSLYPRGERADNELRRLEEALWALERTLR